MERPIYIETRHMVCDECGEELLNGTTCYQHDGTIYCKDCWQTFLEDLTAECEMEAEDVEKWS